MMVTNSCVVSLTFSSAMTQSSFLFRRQVSEVMGGNSVTNSLTREAARAAADTRATGRTAVVVVVAWPTSVPCWPGC